MLKASYNELPSNLHSEGFLVVVMWLPETCMLCFLPGERGMWLAWCWIPPYIWKYIKSNKYLQEGKVSILTQQKLEPSILSEYRSITHPFDKIFTFISVYSIIPVKVPVNDDPQSLISPRGCILNLCRWNGLSIFLQFTGWSEEYFKTLQNLPTVEFKLFWSLLLRLSPASPAQACCSWTPSSVCPGWRRSRLQSQWSRG